MTDTTRDAAAAAELVEAAGELSRLAKQSGDYTADGGCCFINAVTHTDAALSRLTAPAPQPREYGFDKIASVAGAPLCSDKELATIALDTNILPATRLAALRELERRVREEGGDGGRD